MKSSIAATTPFLALSLLGFYSGLVEALPAAETKADGGSAHYVMQRNFNYTKTPNKVYSDPSGEVAFTIIGNPANDGFKIVDDKQQSVMVVNDAQITCSDPFSYSIADEQLKFTSHAPPPAPINKPSNPRAWTITYNGTDFKYVRPDSLQDDGTITGPNGVLDTSITNSFDDKTPAWKTQAFGRSVITINIKPSDNSKLPAKYTIGLLALQQEHAQKCPSGESK